MDRELLQRATGTWGIVPIKICYATVVSVDVDSRTCIVDSCDENKSIDGMRVRLMPEISDGEFDKPELESTIVIGWSDFTTPFMIKSSWLEEKSIIIGNQGWNIKDGLQVFNEGEYGGLVKIIDPEDENVGLLARMNEQEERYNDLVGKHNSLKDNINDLKSILQALLGGAPIPEPGNGAPSALQTALNGVLTTWYPSITEQGEDIDLTTQEQLENPNITHGLLI